MNNLNDVIGQNGMSETPLTNSEVPKPGLRLVQALIPFTAQGHPLSGGDERYVLFDTFNYGAEENDVELPPDIPIGRVNKVHRKLGALILEIEVALLNESSGMLPDYEGTGRLVGAISCSLHEDTEDYAGENQVGWEYMIYSSDAVEIMHGEALNDEFFPRFPEMRDEFHAVLRSLGFDEQVDDMEAGYDASLEDDVNYADERHIDSLLALLEEKNPH